MSEVSEVTEASEVSKVFEMFPIQGIQALESRKTWEKSEQCNRIWCRPRSLFFRSHLSGYSVFESKSERRVGFEDFIPRYPTGLG